METFLQQQYIYGGELWTLGDIVLDLQKRLPNQQCVDRYLQGFLRNPSNNLTAAFAELHKVAKSAWDNIDAIEYVKSLRQP